MTNAPPRDGISWEVLNQLNRSVSGVLNYVDNNRILNAVLGLFLVLYAALAAPILPMSVSKIFRNTWIKKTFFKYRKFT